jgi:hypothetical protein
MLQPSKSSNADPLVHVLSRHYNVDSQYRDKEVLGAVKGTEERPPFFAGVRAAHNLAREAGNLKIATSFL